MGEISKAPPAAPGRSAPSARSKQHVLLCPLPKLFDGEIRGKAKSRVGVGEPGTNTIKGLEGRGLGACGDFPAHHWGRGGYLQVGKHKGDAVGCWRWVCAPQQVCNNFLGLLLGRGRMRPGWARSAPKGLAGVSPLWC